MKNTKIMSKGKEVKINKKKLAHKVIRGLVMLVIGIIMVVRGNK